MFALRYKGVIGNLRFDGFKAAAIYLLMRMPVEVRTKFVIVRIEAA